MRTDEMLLRIHRESTEIAQTLRQIADRLDAVDGAEPPALEREAEPYGWALLDGTFTRDQQRAADWHEAEYIVLPLYAHPLAHQEVSGGGGLREAAERVWRDVERVNGGRGGGFYCTGCSAQPLQGEASIRHADDCPWVALRAALGAVPPGEGEKSEGREVVQPESGGFEPSTPPEEGKSPGKAPPSYHTATPAEISRALRQHMGPQPRRAIAAYHALVTGQPVPPPHSSDPAWFDNGPASETDRMEEV